MLGYSRDSFHRFKELATKTLQKKRARSDHLDRRPRPHKLAGEAASAASICVSICPQRFSISKARETRSASRSRDRFEFRAIDAIESGLVKIPQ
jgi:hypothetical protein